ncbi:MAG: hypothetical protein ACJAUK_002189 [Colwellia polaris]|jgi:hypothetical protein
MSKRIWNKPGIPHLGWEFIRTYSLDSPAATCEMCDQKNIRYLDVLKHENYEGEIKVGQDCSELMMIPGKNGFRWPGTDILILEIEHLKQFGIFKGNNPCLERFASLEEAKKWVIENELYL